MKNDHVEGNDAVDVGFSGGGIVFGGFSYGGVDVTVLRMVF